MTISALFTTAKHSNTVAEESIALITNSTGPLDITAAIVFSRAGCTLVGRITIVVDPDTHKIVSINYGSLDVTQTLEEIPSGDDSIKAQNTSLLR